MATYRYTNTSTDGLSLKLNERPLYGSSRLGSLRKQEELRALPTFSPQAANPIQQVDLNYELTDHLGRARPERSRRVTAVVTGRLLDGNGGGTPKQAELLSAQGYEPFGSLLPGRNYSSANYRFGFNGMEKDDEMHGATGTSYDFGARLYDPRVGRWLSLDPLAMKYPYYSPYAFVGNSPIQCIDPNGKEIVVHYRVNGKDEHVVLRNASDVELLKSIKSDGDFTLHIYEAIQYLYESSGKDVLVEAISHEKSVNMFYEEDGGSFNWRKDKNLSIGWDPLSGMEIVTDAEGAKPIAERIGTGEIQSPAMTLLHEIGHFLGYAKDGRKAHKERVKPYESESPDFLYTNPEEKRVVKEIETPAANDLGEPTRTNHRGLPAKTGGPTSREKVGEQPARPRNTKGL